MFGLFEYTGAHYSLQINPASDVANVAHLDYFHFIGRVIGMALFHGRCIDGGFTLAFYKRILDRKACLQDLELVDHDFYQSLAFIRDNDVDELDLELYFSGNYYKFDSLQEEELKPGGREIKVTEANKMEYLKLSQENEQEGEKEDIGGDGEEEDERRFVVIVITIINDVNHDPRLLLFSSLLLLLESVVMQRF
ncbi:E3 ubiquitin-protein ligase Itchy [Echinococcus granulosus]|uniref:HECT-type E3 ubiquitin transferase n=1 Tax=Echinococcus granulosus TaxID=6210 RepID=W6UGU7_ECHGR|nr:E3 ubiquitin-protein ligase Itchy [Echinococcus granulosus]EUB60755.1 E3 ubiquitin-protein ligase Itchy [Echinococcus granulosus]